MLNPFKKILQMLQSRRKTIKLEHQLIIYEKNSKRMKENEYDTFSSTLILLFQFNLGKILFVYQWYIMHKVHIISSL